MTKVLIADDHEMFREGLKAVLIGADPKLVVTEAKDGDEALEQAERFKPEIVLLDVSMPGRAVLEVIPELKKMNAEVAILILTAHPENDYALRCIRSGADGYLTKVHAADELLIAIRMISSGEKYVSASLAAQLSSGRGGAEARPHQKLSTREFQAMLLIASGKTVSEIGRELGLSVKTISTYRSRILNKLELANNAQIMHYAVREELIEISPASA